MERNHKNKNAVGKIIYGMLIVFIFITIICMLIPNDKIHHGENYYNIDTERNSSDIFESKYTNIRYDKYGIYTYWDENKKLFKVLQTSGEGLLNNKYDFKSIVTFDSDTLTNPTYEKAVNIRMLLDIYLNLNDGNNYACTYVGIVPLDCESVSIDGVGAEIQRMSFDVDEQHFDFNLYYLTEKATAITSPDYSEEVICTASNGKTYMIQTLDGCKSDNLNAWLLYFLPDLFK